MINKKASWYIHSVKNNTRKIFSKNKFILLAFLIFIVPRTIGLGTDIANLDTTHWYPRMYNFTKYLLRGSYKDTYQKYHPGVTLLWTSGFANYTFEKSYEAIFDRSPRYAPYQFTKVHFISKFPLVLLISLLGVASTWILSRIINEKFAYIFAVILSLEPFFLGVSRFLHLSALTSMFAFTSFLYLYYFYHTKKKDKKYFYISAILLGFGLLTKVTAVITGLSITLLILYFELIQNRNIKKTVKNGFVYGLITFLTFYMFFPSMWVAPFWTLQQMKEKGIGDTAFSNLGSKSYFGTQYTYYIEMIFFRSLPTTFIAFIAGIYIGFLKRFKKYRLLFIWVLISLVVILITLSIPSKVKDRYLINAYPQISLISTVAIYYLIKQKKKLVRNITIGILVFMYAITIYRYYPVFSEYYTDFIGGPIGRERLGLNVTNRGEYYAQAARYINKIDDRPYNRNVVVSHRAQDKTFGKFFYGQTFTNPKFLPDNHFADYITIRNDRLDQVPKDSCKPLKSFGPKDPFGYTVITVYKCKGIDNNYKRFRN